jgi:serine/threonine-protein kinase
MGFIEGARPHFYDEIAGILRSRLQAAALVLAILLALVFIWNLFSEYDPLIGIRALIVCLFIGGVFVLRSPRWFSLAQLRWFEGGLFGALVVQLLLMMGARLTAFAKIGDTVSFIAAEHVYLASWAILILTYSILIPNTWQRALAILLPTACLPYGLVLWLYWQLPGVEVAFQADKMGHSFPAPLAAVLIAVFGAYTMNVIRREAFNARQLGQYVLKKRLGLGGMGEVYEAEHRLLKRPCAVKLIRADDAKDEVALARFEREVRATAKLTHWNTVEIFDYGHTDDGTFYYVMELLPGLNLEELVAFHGPLCPERAVHFLRQACRALREAHCKGLFHRDIKPANIIAAERGGVYDVAKLLDFGLVLEQTRLGGETTLTAVGAFGGTPDYMCPEQMDSYHTLDARSDIYSLGAVAYYLVTGRPPFVADSPWDVMVAHCRDPLVPPTEMNPGVPSDLETIIVRCLAKKPADRFQDVESLEKALAQCDCAGKWTEEQAAAWWRNLAGQEVNEGVEHHSNPTDPKARRT